MRDSLRELVESWTHVGGGVVGVVVCQLICFFVEGGLEVVGMMKVNLGSAVGYLSQDG